MTGWVRDFGDPDSVFRVTAVLLGLGQVVTSAEYLTIRGEFGSGGLYSWPVMRLFAPRRPRAVRAARDTVFGPAGVTGMLAMRLLAAVVLVAFGSFDDVALVAVLVLTALLLAFNVRLPWGREGADDIAVQVALGLSVFAVCRALDVGSLGLYFVAAYAGLAYVTAGVTKVVAPAWRSGEALRWVVNLQSFGSPRAYDLLGPRPRLRWWCSWAVMLFEIAFPLAVLLPAPGVMAYLVAGLAFHAVLAVVMGLNTFVWSFAATYPAVLLVWNGVH